MHLFLSLRAPRSERPRRSWSAAGVVSIRCLPYGQAVRTLAEGDVREVALVAAELAALDDAEPFPVAVLARLATLVGSRDATYTELDRGREAFLYEACWEDGVGGTSIRPEPDRPSDTLWWRLRHQHPIRAYRERTDDWTSTRLMLDFVSMREFHAPRSGTSSTATSSPTTGSASGSDPRRLHQRGCSFSRASDATSVTATASCSIYSNRISKGDTSELRQPPRLLMRSPHSLNTTTPTPAA